MTFILSTKFIITINHVREENIWIHSSQIRRMWDPHPEHGAFFNTVILFIISRSFLGPRFLFYILQKGANLQVWRENDGSFASICISLPHQTCWLEREALIRNTSKLLYAFFLTSFPDSSSHRLLSVSFSAVFQFSRHMLCSVQVDIINEDHIATLFKLWCS